MGSKRVEEVCNEVTRTRVNSDDCYAPLMLAAKNGELDVVVTLLNGGANPNLITETTKETALTLAAAAGFLNVVEALCDWNADIELGLVTPLMKASEAGHLEIVKHLLERQANAGRRNPCGYTALGLACINGHTEVAKLFIEKEGQPHRVSKAEFKAFLVACFEGKKGVIECFLIMGIDFHEEKFYFKENTPFSMACSGGHISSIKFLLEKGANPFHRLSDGSTAFMHAALYGHLDVITILVDHTRKMESLQRSNAPQTFLDIDAFTYDTQNTALGLAAYKGNRKVVDQLLHWNANIEHRHVNGSTPLILAVTARRADVVQLLLNNNANVEAETKHEHNTSLTLAAFHGDHQIVKMLLRKGANVEHRNKSKDTALLLASGKGFPKVAQLLLKAGADVDSQLDCPSGITPLMVAKNANVAKVLLQNGANLEAKTINRESVLIFASRLGNHEIVKLCLKNKQDIEQRSVYGSTPLIEAALGNHVNVGKILIQNGADVNATLSSNVENTALTIAASKGHELFVELLLKNNAKADFIDKKGCNLLWQACYDGQWRLATILCKYAPSDLEAPNKLNLSCAFAAFQQGNEITLKYIAPYVQNLPSDKEMRKFIARNKDDKKLLLRLEKCKDHIENARIQQNLEAKLRAEKFLAGVTNKENQQKSNQKQKQTGKLKTEIKIPKKESTVPTVKRAEISASPLTTIQQILDDDQCQMHVNKLSKKKKNKNAEIRNFQEPASKCMVNLENRGGIVCLPDCSVGIALVSGNAGVGNTEKDTDTWIFEKKVTEDWKKVSRKRDSLKFNTSTIAAPSIRKDNEMTTQKQVLAPGIPNRFVTNAQQPSFSTKSDTESKQRVSAIQAQTGIAISTHNLQKVPVGQVAHQLTSRCQQLRGFPLKSDTPPAMFSLQFGNEEQKFAVSSPTKVNDGMNELGYPMEAIAGQGSQGETLLHCLIPRDCSYASKTAGRTEIAPRKLGLLCTHLIQGEPVCPNFASSLGSRHTSYTWVNAIDAVRKKRP